MQNALTQKFTALTSKRAVLFFYLLLLFINKEVLAQNIKEQRIDIRFDNVTLKEALRKIEAAGSVSINYRDEELNLNDRVQGNYINKTVASVLTAVLDKYDLTYKIYSGSNIFIEKKERPKKKSILTGQVKDRKTGDPLIGVIVRGGDTGALTDTEGYFSMELAEGAYTITASYMGYHPASQQVTLQEGRETNLAIIMSEDQSVLNEVIISERKITGTNIALIDAIRNAESIISGVSREQIARSQDRDAAEVVRRIPGVSVMQNRFIIVRGLSQRYNSVMLNNAIAPSFEADSRAFSFDILPSSMIDRVIVYKTAVPELPGDFAGGVVKVYTTGMPAKNSLNITYQASVRPNTTGRDFYEQKQGKYAWLGYDDGTYAMPKGVGENIYTGDRRRVTPLFNSNWDAEKKTAPIDHRFGLDFAKRVRISSKVKLGLVGALTYSNTYQYTVFSRNTGLYLNGYTPAYNFSDEVYTHTVRLNGLLNLSMDIGNRHKIDFKNLYTHTGDFEYTDRNGISGPLADDGTGLYAGQYIHQMTQTNAFRDILSSQLTGSHDLFKHTKINWLLAYTKSQYDEPDQRGRTHKAQFTGDENGEGIWDNYIPPVDPSGMYYGRLYFKLPEETRTLGLDIVQPITIGRFNPVIKAGFFTEHKSRSFQLRRLGLVRHSYDDDGDGQPDNDILMAEHSFKWNQYMATNDLKAGYFALEIPFLKRFKFYGGLRAEDNRQHMHTAHYIIGVGDLHIKNDKLSFLPSANLSYNITEQTLVRAAYSHTLNRPEFREIAPFFYYDLRTFSTAFGNPDIKPQADVHNYDLRYEWYPSRGEMINVGVFYKEFFNPIEYFYYNSTSGRNSYQWNNAEKATNYGAEIDAVFSLGRFTRGNSIAGRNLERITLLFNAAYIYSRVDLGAETQVYQDKERPLFGQSPYTVNAALNYTQDSIGLRLNVAYNVIGKRIIMVGNDQNPNVYELPRHSLDFTFSKRIAKFVELRGGIQNILNARHLQMQDSDGSGKFETGGEDYMQWKDNRYLSWYSGTYYTLGVSLRL